MDSIFTKNTKAALWEFIEQWSKVSPIEPNKALVYAENALRYYHGGKSARLATRPFQNLERLWYESLKNGEPDYTVYADDYFLSDIWACWVIYSRKYLRDMDRHMIPNLIEPRNVKSVADLGNGFGYTTAGLKELFPDADVYGTNFENSTQWKFATALGAVRGFEMRPKVRPHTDLVFASEYFEHFQAPIMHLYEVLDVCDPKYLVLANSFGTESVGHFHSDKKEGRQVSRFFNKALKERGYMRCLTDCWNDRPALWVRV